MAITLDLPAEAVRLLKEKAARAGQTSRITFRNWPSATSGLLMAPRLSIAKQSHRHFRPRNGWPGGMPGRKGNCLAPLSSMTPARAFTPDAENEQPGRHKYPDAEHCINTPRLYSRSGRPARSLARLARGS